ncbi:inorganic phosphate transporter Pho88 [Obelidium mucronatum]|nr:inorganic phosphate transporter Pho88 [Obelidium mucronatum]
MAYFTVQLLVLTINYYIRNKITEKNDKTPLIYTEAKSMFEPKNVETVTTTNKEYDITKSNEAMQQTVLAVVMMCVMHFQFGFTRPLLLQSILGLKTLYGTQLFELYILNKPATGALARPWKKNMFEPPAVAATPKEVKQIEKKEAKKKLNKE